MDLIQLTDFHEKFLTCDICSELYKKPRILLCHHTFCQECLEKWAEANEDKELTCPTCRKVWQVPIGGVERLHANYHITGVIDYIGDIQRVEAENKGTICKNCDSCKMKVARSACLECSQVFCDDCAKVHAEIGHNFISVEDSIGNYRSLQAKLKPATCDQHPGLKLNYYCQTCSVPACPECFMAEHHKTGHVYSKLSEVATTTRKLINENLIKVAQRLKYYGEREASVSGVKKELTDYKDQAISDIKTHTENLILKMRENEEKLLEKLQDTYEVKAKELNSQLDSIKKLKNRAKSSFDYSKNLVDIGSDAGLMSVHEKTRKMLEDLLNKTTFNDVDSQKNHFLHYSPNQAFANGQQGYVNDNMAVAFNSFLINKNSYATVNRKENCQLVTNDRHLGRVHQGRAKVTAEVTLKKEEKVASEVKDNNDGTYDISFTPNYKPGTYCLNVSVLGQPVKDSPFKIKPIPLLPLKKVKIVGRKGTKVGQFNFSFGVAVSKTDEIFVTDRENCRVQVFDINGLYKKYLAFGKGWFSGLGVKPWGLAFTRNNHLVITDHTSRQVFELNTDGKLLKTFGARELKDPRGIAVSSDGNIHVTDWDKDCVMTFTPEGKLVDTIGSRGDQPGHFKYPRSIAINSLDQIIVSDCNNNRVQVFDSSGAFLFECGKNSKSNGESDLESPAGVTVDSYDNIIVCDCNNHRILMFDPEGQYIRRVDNPGYKVKYPLAITTLPSNPLTCIVTEEDKFSIMQAD